jgi:hypothetical protein
MLIGFVGGCITHQPGIPYPQLFHRVLMRWFDERGLSGIRFVVSRDHCDDPSHRVETLLAKNNPGIIIIHRSAHTFFTKPMAIFYANQRFVVNPFLFRRSRKRRSWSDYERQGFSSCLGIRVHTPQPESTRSKTTQIPTSPTAVDPKAKAAEEPDSQNSRKNQDQHYNSCPRKKHRRVSLRDLPWLAGDVSGLLNWAIEDELEIVSRAHDHCRRAGSKLLVVGPGLRIGYPWVNRQAHQLDASLQEWADKRDELNYVSLLCPLAGNRSPHKLSDSDYLDAIHFNTFGHRHLAARLEEPLLQEISARSTISS